MDIQYLLWLQDFRVGINDLLTPFMEAVSYFAVKYLFIIPLIIYWMVDKKKGLYAFSSLFSALTINSFIKLTVCAYRPWIRDARVIPGGDAITTATGYSFPSGHTIAAGTMYGALAIFAWLKRRWISIICILLILLTGFSRNYLGVHTPQDVLVGLILSVIILTANEKLFKMLEEHPEREWWFLLGGLFLGWAVIAYITMKPYPMDYVDGKLLVDPSEMMNDGYGDCAKLIAFCVGRMIEKKWINFKPVGFKLKGIVVCLFGIAGLAFFTGRNTRAMFDSAVGSHWGHFLTYFIGIIFCVAVIPFFIRLMQKRSD